MTSQTESFEEALNRLVRGLDSDAAEEGLALLLLELNSFPTFPANDDRYYEKRLPTALLQRPLTTEEERTVVNEMHRLVLASLHGERRAHGASGLIAAMGSANPWIVAPQLLDIFVRHTDELELAELHQAVHALIKMLSRAGPEDVHYSEVAQSVHACDPTETIRQLIAADLRTDKTSECLPLDLSDLSEIVQKRLQI